MIFLHLHKCGGTSLLKYLKEIHNLSYNEETNGNHDVLNPTKYDIVAYEEHAPAFEYMPDTTICVFRHPVDRLWSNYIYGQEMGYEPLMSFKDYCLSVDTVHYGLFNMPNMYIRYFGGTLEKAKERVNAINIVLTLEDDLALLPEEYHINRTNNKRDITPEEYNYAVSLNAGDMELYGYAQELRMRRIMSASKPSSALPLFLNDYGY
jgi:hypothetical protein